MDCGRPRQVSELWAALVRTTGLPNLPPPPWRACERTGQHLGRGEVKGTRAGASRASTAVLARRFRADPHEVGRIEGIGLDSLELGAAATRASVGREPVTAEDCGSDCGAASRTGREHLQGSSPPDIHLKSDHGSPWRGSLLQVQGCRFC